VYKHRQHKCGSKFESDAISNVLPFAPLNSSEGRQNTKQTNNWRQVAK